MFKNSLKASDFFLRKTTGAYTFLAGVPVNFIPFFKSGAGAANKTAPLKKAFVPDRIAAKRGFNETCVHTLAVGFAIFEAAGVGAVFPTCRTGSIFTITTDALGRSGESG